MAYAELVARSSASLLHGASHPEELVESACAFGLAALAIADRDATYGLPQAHVAAERAGLPLICGATVTVSDGATLTLLAESRAGWGQLCRLLTLGRAAAEKGRSRVTTAQVLGHASGLTALLHDGWSAEAAGPLVETFGSSLEVLLTRTQRPTDVGRTQRALALSRALGRPVVASNDVLYHEPGRQRVADVLTCIRRRCRLDQAGRALAPNAERHLLSPDAFARRFHDLPDAVARTLAVAERCRFRLGELTYRYPREVVPDGWTPMGWLTELVQRGLGERYPEGIPEGVQEQVKHELGVIATLDFPSYFLTVHDVVAWARARQILCQGRGSAANSAVCYALGITAIDPSRSRLLFARFLSVERGEPPDIDVDFEHERREEVIQYVYDRYGRHRAGMVSEVIVYRARSAIRDVGKVFGLSLDQVDRLAGLASRWSSAIGSEERERVREIGLDPNAPAIRWTLQIAAEMAGLPRHLSIHSGGFVIAEGDVIDLVPVEPATKENRTIVQWDKYGVEGLRFVKVDLLALGMLTALRKSFELIEGAYGTRWELHTLPAEDPAVYEMFSAADTVGIFQIESRAQQSMLPRLRPRCFYDLVIEVAIVRPGPIQGGMVHPYLRRRNGEEKITLPHPKLASILDRTLGVPLFQEQVMEIAMAVGGFTPGDADELRRAMGAWRRRGGLDVWGERLMAGMAKNGIGPEFCESIFKQIQGFGEYGFPESHAASFALLVYASGWVKRHHPEAFAAGLINSQPMGFYPPRTLIDDARRHAVEVRPIDVLASDWDCTLEPRPKGAAALRVGLRLIKGLREEAGRALMKARSEQNFRSLPDLAMRSGLDKRSLELLAEAGAFVSLEPDRRQAAWKLQGLWTDLPLFMGLGRNEPVAPLPEESPTEALVTDYRRTGLSLTEHPGRMVREALAAQGDHFQPLSRLRTAIPGTIIRLVGLVSSRQRPGTAKGVTFIALEDETGLANLVLWADVWEACKRDAARATLLAVEGRVQRQDDAVSVLVGKAWSVDEALRVQVPSRDFR